MPEPAVSYVPHPDATPEAEISALAAVYRLAIDAARSTGPRHACDPTDTRERINDGRDEEVDYVDKRAD